MSRPEILRHSVTYDEDTVFSLTRIPREMEVSVEPSSFDGRSAMWAEDARHRYGDEIIPIVTDKHNGHSGSWIKHTGIDWQTGEEFSTYHIVCGCAGAVEGNSPISLVEQAAQCNDMRQILQKRAAFVDHTFRTSEILAQLRDDETGDFEQVGTFHDFAKRSIICVLILDTQRPAEWPANLIHGQHQASILATMLQLGPEVTKWYAKTLQENGVVDFDGETISLTDEAASELGLKAA